MKALFLAAILISAPAIAQPTPNPSAPLVGVQTDPNRTICRRFRELGSRLASRRVCATQAEWDQFRREARQGIDRNQMTRVHPNG